MKKQNIITILVLLLLFGVISLVVVYLYYNENNEKQENYNNLTKVDYYNTFFTVNQNINNYLMAISNKDYEKVYELLDKKYIKVNHITRKNVEKNVPSYTMDTSMKVKNMSYIRLGDNVLYFASGYLMYSGYDYSEIVDNNYSIIVLIDYNTFSVSFYPVSGDKTDAVNSIIDIEINNNKYNKFDTVKNITDQDICIVYLNDFNYMMYNDLQSLYDYIESTLKDNSFNDYNSFKTYINNNYDKFSTVVDSCSVDNHNNEYIYNVTDSKGNYLRFTAKYVMDYKVYFELK